MPALRAAPRGHLCLARDVVRRACAPDEAQSLGLAPAAADQLLRYEWPGNVRELENAMERAVALARGSRVELEDLPEEVRHAIPEAAATTTGR